MPHHPGTSSTTLLSKLLATVPWLTDGPGGSTLGLSPSAHHNRQHDLVTSAASAPCNISRASYIGGKGASNSLKDAVLITSMRQATIARRSFLNRVR